MTVAYLPALHLPAVIFSILKNDLLYSVNDGFIWTRLSVLRATFLMAFIFSFDGAASRWLTYQLSSLICTRFSPAYHSNPATLVSIDLL